MECSCGAFVSGQVLCNLVIVMDHTHTHTRTHTLTSHHIITALHSTFATPKSDSTPKLRYKTPLHRIHSALSSQSSKFWQVSMTRKCLKHCESPDQPTAPRGRHIEDFQPVKQPALSSAARRLQKLKTKDTKHCTTKQGPNTKPPQPYHFLLVINTLNP